MRNTVVIAGISYEQMKDILSQQGIKPELGPEIMEEAKQDYVIC